MIKVAQPQDMNDTFARVFNTRKLEDLLALYEPNAILYVDAAQRFQGREQIAAALANFLQMPGTLAGRNNFCVVHEDLALLRADYALIGADGATLVAGSSAEIARRQADGTWLYVVDHAVGASLPRVI
jgi:ketosteroid isomerase-like protein